MMKVVLDENCDIAIGLLAGATVIEAFYDAQESESDKSFRPVALGDR